MGIQQSMQTLIIIIIIIVVIIVIIIMSQHDFEKLLKMLKKKHLRKQTNYMYGNPLECRLPSEKKQTPC